MFILDMVLEHPLRSLICSYVAEGPFHGSCDFVVDYILNESYDVLNVVSHGLNTKETLPKFSRNITLNHIGESLGSRGGKLRKPKMKTLFWCHPNPCSVGCPFQSQNLVT